jgi:hypothetical protein
LSVVESVVLTETTDQVYTPLRMASDDTITLSDGPVLVMGEPGILYVFPSDTITLVEELFSGENPILGVIADSVTVTDEVYGRQDGPQILNQDLIALTEDLGVCISPLRVASDDLVTVGETSDVGFNPMLVSSSETVTVTESHTLGVGSVPGTYLLTNDAHWTARCVKKERLINV